MSHGADPALLFSVVINTYNRAATLAATLDALRLQRHREFEVIVVNGPSDDGTDALLAARADELRIVSCPERHLARSRNLGIEAAAGEVVAFVDDDAVPGPDWLSSLSAAYADPGVAGAGGTVLDESGVRLQYRYSVCDRIGRVDFDRAPPFDALVRPGAEPFLYLQGTNMSFRRTALADVGGFDEEIEYNYDEVDVCLRLIDAGHPLVSLDGAWVQHKVAPSHLRGGARQALDPFAEIKNRTYFAVRHGQGQRSLDDVLALLQPHLTHQRAVARDRREAGELGAAELARFEQRLAEGFETGVQRGLAGAPAGRPLAAPDPSAYLRHPAPEPPGRRLRVAFVSLDYPPGPAGGIARYTRDLGGAMAADGHDVHVITRHEGEDRRDLEDGVWVHRHPEGERFVPELDGSAGGGALKHLAAVHRAVARLHGELPLDLVCGPLWAAEPLLCLADPRLRTVVTCMTPMRVVAAEQPEVARPETGAQIQLEDALLATAPHLHVISRAILATLRATAPALRATEPLMLPLGIRDQSIDHPRRRAAQDEHVDVLFVGRLEPRKGTDVLLESGALLLRARPRVRLRLIGVDTGTSAPGGVPYERRFRDAHPDLADRVRFDGELPDDALFAGYADADVVCVPSRYESFGLVLLEAMSFGRPVVACAAGGIEEIVVGGETGLLVAPGDPIALGDALRRIIDDGDLRARLGAAGRARYESAFAAQAAARRLAAAFATVADTTGIADGTTDAEGAVHAAATRIAEEVIGLAPSDAQRAAHRLLAPDAFPRDYEAVVRRLAAIEADEEFVRALYEALLGREPDLDGLHDRVGLLAGGASRLDIIRMLVCSDEGRARGLPPSLADRVIGIDPGTTVAAVRRAWMQEGDAFVTDLAIVFGSAGDTDALAGRIRPALASGRRSVLDRALADPGVAPSLTHPTRFALAAADLRTGAELDRALADLARRDDESFLRGLYRLLLGRAADGDGLAAHRAALRDGGARAAVVQALATSSEAVVRGIDPTWAEGLEARVPRLAPRRGAARITQRVRRRLARGLVRAGSLEERLAEERESTALASDRRARVTEAALRRLDARIDALNDRLRRDRALHDAEAQRLRGELGDVSERAAAFTEPRVFGPPDRLVLAESAQVHDALFNTVSGRITVGEHAFFGHGVAVLTGTHDVDVLGADRQSAIPAAGRDVEIGEGAWIATRAVVLGPCRIGAHAVVAAGSVVTDDVADGVIVAGVPAREVRRLPVGPTSGPQTDVMRSDGSV